MWYPCTLAIVFNNGSYCVCVYRYSNRTASNIPSALATNIAMVRAQKSAPKQEQEHNNHKRLDKTRQQVCSTTFSGILPADHKPARGRRRKHQLMAMTDEQIEAETEVRMEKNRQSARDCRVRKKQHIASLRAELNVILGYNSKQQAQIQKLTAQVQSLVDHIEVIGGDRDHATSEAVSALLATSSRAAKRSRT